MSGLVCSTHPTRPRYKGAKNRVRKLPRHSSSLRNTSMCVPARFPKNVPNTLSPFFLVWEHARNRN